MKCKSCNASIPEGSLTCPGCGKSIDELKSLGLIEETSENMSIKSEERTTDNSSQAESPTSNEGSNITKVDADGIKSPGDKPKTKNNNFLLPIIVLILVTIGAGVAYLWYSSSKPKFVFESLIKATYESAKEYIKTDIDSSSTTFSLKAKIDAKESNELYDLINKFDLNGTVTIDYKNSTMNIDFDSNYDKDELFKTNMFYKEDRAYILLEGLFDKYISTEIEKINFENTSSEDVQYATTSILDALNKSLKDGYFTKDKEDGLTKTTLNLNNKVVKEISISVLEQLKEDDKFLASISNLYGETGKDEIKKVLENALQNVEKMDGSEKDVAKLSIFTVKNSTEVKKIEFTVEGSDDHILINVDNGKYDIELVSKETGTIKFTIDNSSKDKFIFIYEVADTKFEVEMNYSVKYNEKVVEPDVSNSVAYDKLTENDMKEIEENMSKNKGLTKLIEDIQKVTELLGFGSDGYDDYDYDYNFDDENYNW